MTSQPGNGEGLFWFRHFINLLTFLRHPLTALGPTWGFEVNLSPSDIST